jgi:hypothetical protein
VGLFPNAAMFTHKKISLQKAKRERPPLIKKEAHFDSKYIPDGK